MPERVFQRVPRWKVYQQTGIQVMQINTLFQLFSMVQTGDPQLDAAETFLMIPDLFHYWLTGRVASEYTIASTSQMLHSRRRLWATALGNLLVQAMAMGQLADVAAGREAVAATVEQQRFDPQPGGGWGEAYGRFNDLLCEGVER